MRTNSIILFTYLGPSSKGIYKKNIYNKAQGHLGSYMELML